MTGVAASQLVMPAVVGWLLMTAPGPMGASAPGTRSLDMADIITREVPSEPCVSPDGVVVAFVVSRSDTVQNRRVGDIWSVTIDPESFTPKARVRWTNSAEPESDLEWAPVGRMLAFRWRSSRGKGVDGGQIDSTISPRSQVWIQGRPGEAPARVTTAPEGIDEYIWFRDGSAIVYQARQPWPGTRARLLDDRKRGFDGRAAGPDTRPWEFYSQSIAGGRPVLITTIEAGLTDWDLSPDGRLLVYASNGGDPLGEESPTDLWLFDRKDGSTRRLTTRWGPDTDPMFTFDGGRIAWKADQDTTLTYSQEEIWSMALDGSDKHCLSLDIDEPLSPVGSWPQAWSDGVVVAERASRSRNRLTLLRLGVASGDLDREIRASFVGEFCRPSDNQVVAFVSESLEDWPEVWVLSSATVRKGSSVDHRAITDLEGESPLPGVSRFGKMESTSADGLTTESLLALPDSAIHGPGPWPTITQLHGGPYNRNTARLRDNPTALVLASHGYLVYMPNFRGSKGYGNAFGTATKGDFAEGPCRDVMAGLDSLIARGLADSSRLGIMGGSYGGYLTMWSISQSDRFKAAVSMYGFSSLITDFGNGQSPSYELEFLGDPYWKGNRLWTELSPAWHVDRIHTPLLLLHGEHDPAVGISNSREMWTALTVLRRPVEFITYPREGHGFREPNHRIDASRRTLAWFDRWLR